MTSLGQTRYFSRKSRLNAAPAHGKILALLTFVCAVVTTQRSQFWAFAAYAFLLGGGIRLAQVPLRVIARSLKMELPFMLFALALPFMASGQRTVLLGLSMSADGLLGAWNIMAKSTLGTAASGLLVATTTPQQILLGLQRLKTPAILLQIMSLMLRYSELLADNVRKLRIAQQARCGPMGIRRMKIVAHTTTTLFIRSFERGERIHLAMLSRGYCGTFPEMASQSISRKQWLALSWLPITAWGIVIMSWVTG